MSVRPGHSTCESQKSARPGRAGGGILTDSFKPSAVKDVVVRSTVLGCANDMSNVQAKPGTQGSSGNGGVAATILGIPPGGYSGEFKPHLPFGDKAGSEQSDLPQSVLQVIATSLQCDLVIAAILQNPLRLAETVLCVPKGLVTVPLRFSKSALVASTRCEVCSTESLLLPSMLTAVLGARPRRFLATHFHAEGYEGLCYALWLDPDKVPDIAESVMAEAGQSLPLLLASSARANCCDRMGRRFDVMLQKMPQAVAFVDDGNGQCLINPTAAHLLGFPGPGEYDARLVAQGMCHLADRSNAVADVYMCLNMIAGSPNQIRDWVWVLKHPRCVLQVRSYPISSVAAHGRVWLFDDITSEQDAHDAIEEANMAKSQFLAMMSHELRTPMTGVLGMLDLLRLTSLTVEQARFLRVMQGSAEGLMQVLNEILDFSKIQSGHLALEDVDFDISELLEQVSALFQGRLAEKKLKLTIDLPSKEDLYVHGDPNRLRQVLSNLVSNAIKFTEEGGINISWKRVGRSSGYVFGDSTEEFLMLPLQQDTMVLGMDGVLSSIQNCQQVDREENPTRTDEKDTDNSDMVDKRIWFQVRVSDSGIGLTKEQQGRLFQSFSQADSSTTRKFGGTGLGLAICKGLVEVMGGKIWVESEPRKGSTFAFCLPLSRGMQALEMQSGRVPLLKKFGCLRSQGRALKVLVAEDNMVNQLLIRKMLKHYGHEVELVGNGQLAVDAIQRGQHDMILMDLQMPVLDGLSATKAIRALGGQTSLVPIYALTADVLTKGKDSLESMGLDGYLTKPINWDNLSQVIDLVAHSRSSDRCWEPS
ncbi:unnamed protein product [Calypogeia fissa]